MKNRFLRDALKWGAALACLNFVMALVLPMSNSLDMLAIVIISPVTGFIGGVVIYILNFVAIEVMKYSKYRLTKLEGSKWNDISALLGERGITSSGKIGAGFALGLVALVAYTIPSEEAGTIPPFAPLFLVVGFGFGIFAYFSQWVLGLILSGVSTKILPHRDQTFRESGKLLAALKQLYMKWKNHDYRS